MKPLRVKDCLSSQSVVRVLEEARPDNINHEVIYAVFRESTENGVFCGLVTSYDIAVHPNWIFADLCEHRPLSFVYPKAEVSQVIQTLEQAQCDVLAVLDKNQMFLGIVSKNSILAALLAREHTLLARTSELHNRLEAEHAQVLAWSRKLAKLHAASRTLLSVLAHTSLEVDLLQAGIDALTDLLQARYGAIGIMDDNGRLCTFVHTGLSEQQVKEIGRLPEGKGLLGVVIKEDSPLLVDDISKDPRSCGFPPHHPHMKTLLAVPVSYEGHVHGRIYLCDKRSEEPFSKEDEQLAQSFAHSLSLVIDNARQIKEIQQAQKSLEYQAHYDALTGLPNRILLTDRFHQAVAHSKRSQTQLAVCFLDLDNFKPVNDQYGHETGDQVLLEVAKRITSIIREEDTVSRQGGDEFVILLTDLHSVAQCEDTLERIHHALMQPYQIGEHTHHVTASSGVTIYPLDDADMDTLVRHADQAMYQAKVSGRNKYHFFNVDYAQKVEHKRHQLSAVRQALENNELCLYYQPKVVMNTGKVLGVEALIRWHHPQKGVLSPSVFLSVVEGTDLDIQIGNWVIEQVLKQVQQWHSSGLQLEISINISSHHFLADDFVSRLDNMFKRYPAVSPEWIQLEILESSALINLKKICSRVAYCQKTWGLHFALDDFGTGYSSLTHLRNLAVDSVKIDQSFVHDLLDDPNDYAIISGVIALADSFDRSIIAEGVETSEQGLMLQFMGCEYAQGYGIARPMPADQFATWIAQYMPNQAWINNKVCHYSEKEKKIKIFRLTSSQWQTRFIANLHSQPEEIETWPVKDAQLCHCGYWIKRARQGSLFESRWLDKLEASHHKMHAIAEDLLTRYQAGEQAIARRGIEKFKAAFTDMMAVLDQCPA